MKRLLPALVLACALSRLAPAGFTVVDAKDSGPSPLYQSITDAFSVRGTTQDETTLDLAQNPARLKNISARARVEGGDHVTIAGFIISGPRLELGQVPRVLVVRAIGPSLTGIHSPLSDPALEVYHANGVQMAKNDNWRHDSNAQFIEGRGLGPTRDLEAALVGYVGGGNYTAVLRGTGGAIGTAVVEVYDVDPSSDREVLNISTRAFVGPGDDVLIAGTIFEQSAGSTRIVARAIGPSLAAVGVTDSLADPMLELHDNQGALIAANDDWRDGQADELVAAGLAPTNDRESAIFIPLGSASYTAVVRGKGTATGVGIVELYNLH